VLAHTRDFGDVYNLSAQDPLQRQLYEGYARGLMRMGFDPVPMPYLPIFVAFFEPILLVSPVVGYLAWIVVNGAAVALAVTRIVRHVPLARWKRWALVVALSLWAWPVRLTSYTRSEGFCSGCSAPTPRPVP
jgi:hypothetical protein